MSGAESGVARKQAYFSKLIQCLDEYPKILLVIADNVGSYQMQKIRIALRGKAVILMGKNTMVRKAIRGHLQNNPNLEVLLNHIWGNIGFVLAKGDLGEIRKIIMNSKVAAPAKVGVAAPKKVIVPAGATGLEPTQTSFFQALNIPTKIARGQIEIINDIVLIEEGQRVGASENNLLQKLNIKPFEYGLVVRIVYDNGAVYDPKVLDLSDDDIISKFRNGVRNIASVSLQVGLPTVASLPHSIIRGYKNVLAVALATDFEIEATKKLKDILANPQAYSAPPAQPSSTPTSTGKQTKDTKEKKKPEPEPEPEEEDMGLGLFD